MPDTAPAALLTPAALAAALGGLARDEFSPLGRHSYALLDLHAADDGAARACAALLPACPVIGIGATDSKSASLCDATYPTLAAAAAALRQITRTPLAASLLVQTLRNAAGLALTQALHLESLTYASLQAGPEFAAWRAALGGMPAPPAAAGPPLALDRRGAELWLTLDRAETHNAIDIAMRDALAEAFALAALDDEIRAIRLQASGRAFCSGGALWEFGTAPDAPSGHIVRSLRLPAALLLRAGKPLAAHVNGACIGSGLEIAAFAQRLTASANAWFQLPELAMGLIPGAGGTVSIPSRIGRQAACALMLSGQRLRAPAALRIGLIDAIL